MAGHPWPFEARNRPRWEGRGSSEPVRPADDFETQTRHCGFDSEGTRIHLLTCSPLTSSRIGQIIEPEHEFIKTGPHLQGVTTPYWVRSSVGNSGLRTEGFEIVDRIIEGHTESIAELLEGILTSTCAGPRGAALVTLTNGDGAKYTRGRGPLELVHEETYESRSKAMSREHEIKDLTRREKENLIEGQMN